MAIVSDSFIEQDRLVEYLKKKSKPMMLDAAEPVIQEAMKEIEIRLRQSVGSIVLGLIENSYEIMRDGHNLKITVFNKKVE